MSDDDAARNPVTPDHDPESVTSEGQSRRDLLKAAVVGSAAVAAIAGAGTAGLALAGKKPAVLSFVGDALPSNEGCSGCVTGSQSACSAAYPQLGCIDPPVGCAHPQFRIVPTGNPANPSTNPGSFYVWVTVANVPANASISMTFTLPSGFSTMPGNPYFLYTAPAGTASTCPTTTAANCGGNGTPVGSTFIKNASSLAGLFPYAVGPTSVDVELMVHVKYSGPEIGNGNHQDFTFSFSATQTPAGGGPTPVCEGTLTITGVQTSQ
jgi:hypothetical protein